ncbi:MAG TPA: Ser-Thr-rich GPI-anchored membrane family protein [Cyclobacteriaceae bacterium]|nr:Ser-Thr-rich GPI-anchored membrane family protein [Cyclobacteriaceae bacterium]
MKKVLLLFFSVIVLGSSLSAQDFTIKKVEWLGDDINLYYDLKDSVAHRSYTVSLFSSKDNFISPLQKVSGDIDLEVKPGANKKITWRAKEELGADFEGKVALEVRGRIYIPFVRLDGSYSTMKRLKDYEITWTGGTAQNILNFDLYRGTEKVTSFPNIANVGHFTLQLPSSVKPGKDYWFRISDSKNKDQIVNSSHFVVKRKVPLLVKLVPIAAVAAVVPLFINPAEADPGVPEAPGPPKP